MSSVQARLFAIAQHDNLLERELGRQQVNWLVAKFKELPPEMQRQFLEQIGECG